jgi:hypothetical protein
MRNLPRPGEGLTDQQRRLAEYIAEGHALSHASKLAGYSPNTQFNRGSIVNNDSFKFYLFHLREQAATNTIQSMEILIRQLDDARMIALLDRDPGAVIQAVMAKAKLLGLSSDRQEIELNIINKPAHAPTTIVDLSVDEWREKHAPKALQ